MALKDRTHSQLETPPQPPGTGCDEGLLVWREAHRVVLGQHSPDAGKQKVQSTPLPSADDVLWMMSLEGGVVLPL